MKDLPPSVRAVVRQHETLPAEQLAGAGDQDEPSPYSAYWFRCVPAMLLSGRVQSTAQGMPNRTDCDRLCKEANFNQYLCEHISRFLLAARVLQPRRRGRSFEHGPNAAAFWSYDPAGLRTITGAAVVDLAQGSGGRPPRRPPPARLLEFLTLFFHAFRDLAVPEKQVGRAMLALASLPAQELSRLADDVGVEVTAADPGRWTGWLGENDEQALLTALYLAWWAHVSDHEGQGWFHASPTGLAMLGLAEPPPVAPLPGDLRVLADLSVFAGAGRPLDDLAVLYRHCQARRVSEVFEFRLERQRLLAASSRTPASAELRALFAGVGPLPATVEDLLQARSALGGVLRVRGCSALVRPPSPEALEAIRKHPRLKWFIEPGAPPGYLLIKQASDPGTFVERCRELGFEVETL